MNSNKSEMELSAPQETLKSPVHSKALKKVPSMPKTSETRDISIVNSAAESPEPMNNLESSNKTRENPTSHRKVTSKTSVEEHAKNQPMNLNGKKTSGRTPHTLPQDKKVKVKDEVKKPKSKKIQPKQENPDKNHEKPSTAERSTIRLIRACLKRLNDEQGSTMREIRDTIMKKQSHIEPSDITAALKLAKQRGDIISTRQRYSLPEPRSAKSAKKQRTTLLDRKKKSTQSPAVTKKMMKHSRKSLKSESVRTPKGLQASIKGKNIKPVKSVKKGLKNVSQRLVQSKKY